MTNFETLEMHRDHQCWRSQNALWRDQLRQWQQDTEQAIADLKTVRQAFAEHEKALEMHAAAIRLCEQGTLEHEHQLAEAKCDASCTVGKADHGTETHNYVHERESHERLKLLHHTLMARWKMMMHTLKAPA